MSTGWALRPAKRALDCKAPASRTIPRAIMLWMLVVMVGRVRPRLSAISARLMGPR